jgi:tetratricopeptide (TPR) repeat protein
MAGRVCLFVLAAVALLGCKGQASSADRFVPTDDRQIVEQLPTRRDDPQARRARELRAALRANPRNVSQALELARSRIEASREKGDPRLLGQAQAALRPWWSATDAPADVLVLRATIRQSNHEFPEALADLERALAQRPDDAQAWLTQAVVLTVVGRYAEARQSCDRVGALGVSFAAAVCRANVDGLTGRGSAALADLEGVLANTPRISDDERSWALSAIGELALRTGDTERAERTFRQVLAQNPNDAYVLGALADLLLDTGRPQEVEALVRGRTDNDALFLRRVLASRSAKAADANALTAALAERYEASRLRGDTVHRREQARFALAIGQVKESLELARANWAVQKETADARILLEGALANRSPDAASPVVAWMDDSRIEDPVLHRLRRELGR